MTVGPIMCKIFRFASMIFKIRALVSCCMIGMLSFSRQVKYTEAFHIEEHGIYE